MHVTPDFRLFCLALRRPLAPDDAAALRAAIAAGPDWTKIVAGARRHRVTPLLLAGLQAGASQVPEAVLAELRRDVLATTARNLAQIAEIGRLSRAFAGAGIAVLALKGVTLSAQLYGDAALRGGRDIDLLADPKDFARLDTVVAAAGYRRTTRTLTPRQDASYRHWIKDLEYVHASAAPVELHHRLADNPHLLPCDFDALWRAREEVRLGDAVVPTLSRRALALYLCVHGASHAWERLRWLVDLTMLLRAPGSVERALADADAAGLGPAMLHALMLAHEWLGLAVEERHLARAQASARVMRLHRIMARLYEGQAWHEMPARGSWNAMLRYSLWARRYRLALKAGWRYRATQAARELFTPADFDIVRLPDALFWLYPLVRPVGWMVRRWGR